jgi:hypothetical protein
MSVAFAEGVVTRLRNERKVLFPADADEAERIWADVTGGSRTDRTCVTSVYLDRPGMPLARRAREDGRDCLKIRVKEYAPDRSGDDSRVVLEVKREQGSLTAKERLWLPRSRVRDVVAGVGDEAVSAKDPRLAPVVAATYERRVFQTAETWRVTLDRAIAFRLAGWEALARDDVPAAARLGPRCGVGPAAVLEVKWVGDDVPAVLRGLVAARARTYSKFVDAFACLAPHAVVEG